MSMGDLVKARDDLMSAARKAPDAKEIRDDLTSLRVLEEEEEAYASWASNPLLAGQSQSICLDPTPCVFRSARALWKQNFITDEMSLRAQSGVTSVQVITCGQALGSA